MLRNLEEIFSTWNLLQTNLLYQPILCDQGYFLLILSMYHIFLMKKGYGMHEEESLLYGILNQFNFK